MRELSQDAKEIFDCVTKDVVAAEDVSLYVIKAFFKLKRCYAAEILFRLNITPNVILEERGRLRLTLNQLKGYADEVAAMTGYREIDTQHLLLAAVAIKNSNAARALKKAGADAERIAQIVEGMSYHAVGKNNGSKTRVSAENVLKLQSRLAEAIVGQDAAIRLVTDRLMRVAAGLGNPDRPIATFLFTGSTGVGKTELAKLLADEMYGRDALIKLDMSEYSDKSSVTMLLGAPPAYVGYGDGGRLTEQVKKKPQSVVLFDEIEKAHRDVMNLLLQVLDEGTLTDSKGNQIDFKNCMIILTANALNYDIIKKRTAIGFDAERTEQDDRELLKEVFPPEILGRLKLIRFRDLSEDDCKKIAAKELRLLNSRLQPKGIAVAMEDAAAEYFCKDGGFGARGIKQRLEETLETKLSEQILSGKLRFGGNVTVRYQQGEILLDIKTSEEAQV